MIKPEDLASDLSARLHENGSGSFKTFRQQLLAQILRLFVAEGYNKFPYPDQSNGLDIIEDWAIFVKGVVEAHQEPVRERLDAAVYALRALVNFESWISEKTRTANELELITEVVMRGVFLGIGDMLTWHADRGAYDGLRSYTKSNSDHSSGGKETAKRKRGWHDFGFLWYAIERRNGARVKAARNAVASRVNSEFNKRDKGIILGAAVRGALSNKMNKSRIAEIAAAVESLTDSEVKKTGTPAGKAAYDRICAQLHIKTGSVKH